jgi:chemotaxis protein histidine kinase CheA/ActR/RegA family two-component response regulator
MPINKEKFVKQYIDEGLDILPNIETYIFKIKDGISTEDDIASLLRALHTLKGNSRMLEFKRIEELSHSLESVFIALREKQISISDNAVKLILSSLDLLKSGFSELQKSKNDNIEIDNYVKNMSLLAENKEFTLPKQEESAEAEKHKESKTETIRLSLDKIDEIIKNIMSLHTLETKAKILSQNSAQIVAQIKKLSKSFKENKSIDPAQAVMLKKLERMCGRLNSSLNDYVTDTGNGIKTAYDGVISLRTLPISTIFDSYPRFVYELSQELGKNVQLTIEGKENEIDKNIIEALSEVIMHMVRNSIDHGIETPKDRLAAGKEETGKLSIVCTRESGNMKIIIADDGRGIDIEKIRQKIVKEGLVDEEASKNLDKEELIDFIFQSGFSTSEKASNISGRGVGMDVVRDSIDALKGSIVVDSVQGEGSKFTIIVPLSVAALMGVPIECNRMKFIIPANFIEAIMLIKHNEIITTDDRLEIKYNDRMIKLYYLNQILKIKDIPIHDEDSLFVVIIRSYEDSAALVVTNIHNMKSVILKTMPAFMKNMNVFSGIVLNEEYEMVSVLHIPTVIKMAKRVKIPEYKKISESSEKNRKSILVVDDSFPTREIEKEILLSEGYIVDSAADGQEALNAARTKHYDLICTDLNMPVMDGFELIKNLKSEDALSKIPIIVISSKDDKEEQKHAFKLGADNYIIKNSFNNHNMLKAVNSLIGEVYYD